MTENLTRSKQYISKDLTFIIPTRNRPEKIKKLLNSIVEQKVLFNQIIIVSSGNRIGSIIDEYNKKLPIKYIHTQGSGQIFQRNLGIENISNTASLVGFLDDDIILCKDSIRNIIKEWNCTSLDIAGIGFNIINEKPHKSKSILVKLKLGIVAEDPGVVMKSGINTSICSIKENIITSWLLGGATIWKKEIILHKQQKALPGGWAVGEDVMFSYPLSKEYILLVSCDSKVRHEHVHDQFISGNIFFNKGKTFTIWKLYFVKSNKDLSLFLYFITFSIISCGKIFRGIIRFEQEEILFAVGMLIGIYHGLFRIISGRQIIQ